MPPDFYPEKTLNLYFTSDLNLWCMLCVLSKSAKKSADHNMNRLHVLQKNSTPSGDISMGRAA